MSLSCTGLRVQPVQCAGAARSSCNHCRGVGARRWGHPELPAPWPPCGCVSPAADGHHGPPSCPSSSDTPSPHQVLALQQVTQTGTPLLQSRRKPRSWAMRTTASLRMPPGTTLTGYTMRSAIRCLSSSGQTRDPALQRQAFCIDSCVKRTVWAPCCKGKQACPVCVLHSCVESAS